MYLARYSCGTIVPPACAPAAGCLHAEETASLFVRLLRRQVPPLGPPDLLLPPPRPPRVQMAKAFALLVAASLVLVGVAQAQSFNQYLGAKNGGTYTHSPR